MMDKLITILLAFLLVLFLASCEQDLAERRTQCSGRTSLYIDTNIVFSGFDFDELQSFRTIRRSNSKDPVEKAYQLLELNFSHLRGVPTSSSSTISLSMYSLDLENLDLNNEIEFQIGPNRKSYVLSNIQMAVLPERLSKRADYSCSLSSYSINGLKVDYVHASLNIEIDKDQG